MKKLLVAMLVLFVSSLSFANDDTKKIDDLANALQQSLKTSQTTAPNKGALGNNGVISYTQKILIDDDDVTLMPSHEEEAVISCKAYALDEHWLIVGGKCARPYSTTKSSMKSNFIDPSAFGVSLRRDEIYFNENIMLAYSQYPLYKGNKPLLHVLAFSQPENIKKLNNSFQINTARFGTDSVKNRRVVNVNSQNLVRLSDDGLFDLRGTATDPIAYVDNNSEFLVGYNNGNIAIESYYYKGEDRGSNAGFSKGIAADSWYLLNEKDLKFIRETVETKNPDDVKRICKKLFLDSPDRMYCNEIRYIHLPSPKIPLGEVVYYNPNPWN